MKSSKRGSPGKFAKSTLACACLGLGLVCGCAATRQPVDRALLASHAMGANPREIAEQYRAGCPDVLAVSIDCWPEWKGRQTIVAVDGRIDLGQLGRLR